MVVVFPTEMNPSSGVYSISLRFVEEDDPQFKKKPFTWNETRRFRVVYNNCKHGFKSVFGNSVNGLSRFDRKCKKNIRKIINKNRKNEIYLEEEGERERWRSIIRERRTETLL